MSQKATLGSFEKGGGKITTACLVFEPGFELGPCRVVEATKTNELQDPPLLLKKSGLPLRRLHGQRRRLAELGCDVRDDLGWDLSGISQETTEQAHDAELHCIDQTVLLGETGDAVEVVDGECPVPSKLLI